MSRPRKTEVQVHCIGTLALDLLSTEQIATVFGIISRGIFMKFDSNRMVFLSFEKYRGPLTANLSGEAQLFSGLSSGETIHITRKGILFSDSGISISILNSKIWQPSFNVENLLHTEDRINLIRKLALDVYQHKRAVGFCMMLPVLVGFTQEAVSWDNQFEGIRKKIDEIRNQIAQGNILNLAQTIKSFLGLGSGLTPSGDDFIIGLLLSLNRWESVFQLGNNLSSLNKKVVDAAYRYTTTLSANLIECAILGLADERLIQVVDFLAAAKYDQSEILPGLLSWGDSSGIDALVGMITAFSTV